MESKEVGKGEIERLAEIRARRKVGSWRKSTWGSLLGLLCVLGFVTLLILWIGVAIGGINVGLAVSITVLVGVLSWFFYRRHKAWDQE